MNGKPIGSALPPILGILALGAGLALVVQHCTGCALLRSPEAAEATYTAEHLRCVDKSATLAESHACRDAVDRRWGITHTLRDAGGDQ